MNEPSVIQTTAGRHREELDFVLSVTDKWVAMTSSVPVNPADLATYKKGLSEGWALATCAILREGNCKFEREG